MEERQPSAAVRVRQTTALTPFCVSKSRKVLHLFGKPLFSCRMRTDTVHSGPPA